MDGKYPIGLKPGDNYPERIKWLRSRLGLTQQALADHLNISFATINRWENGQTKPSLLSWNHIQQLEMSLGEESVP